MKFPFRFVSKGAAVLLLVVLGACAGKSEYMRDVAPDDANYAPDSDTALIVFMRPSGFGFAVQSTVFDVTSGDPVFIGVLPAKAKLAHHTEPGQQRFMVLGEGADFLDADLDGGKVYYATVEPRMGLFKARFSFIPVRGADMSTPEFVAGYNDSRWVEVLPTARDWAVANRPSILEKVADELPDWEQGAKKATLNSEDGQASLYQAE